MNNRLSRNLQSAMLIIVMVLVITPGYATRDSVTVVKYAINKNWVKMIEGVDYISTQEKEKAKYFYGNRSSWTSYGKLWYNDTLSFYSDYYDDEESYGYSWRKDPFLIRRDFTNMEIHDILVWNRKTLIIHDTLITPTWKILNDVREIAGHICMSASYTDTLKGQNFLAWFALDIPSLAGPERICGLPGLVLGLEVNHGAMEIMAQSITREPLNNQLDIPTRFDGRKIKGKTVSETYYQTEVKEFMEDKRKAQEYPFWGVRY